MFGILSKIEIIIMPPSSVPGISTEKRDFSRKSLPEWVGPCLRSEGRLGISNKSFNKNSWYSLRVIALAFLENVKECTSNNQFPQYWGKGLGSITFLTFG